MKDYLREQDYYLEKVWFDYEGGRYEGRGILTWTLTDGFHLDAFVERHKDSVPLPSRFSFGGRDVIGPEDRTAIKMRPAGGGWAVARDVDMSVRLELIIQNRLSANLDRVLFSSPLVVGDGSLVKCSALYAVGSSLWLPGGTSRSEVRIAGDLVEWQETKGISYKSDRLTLRGRMVDESHLLVQWEIPTKRGNRHYCWNIAIGLRDALSMLYGRNVQLLRRDLVDGKHKFSEKRRGREVQMLRQSLSLFCDHPIDEPGLVKLADFLARDEPLGDICRRIFSQLLDASRQFSHQGTELLCSTILEAILRSVNSQPFEKRPKPWKRVESMDQFRSRFLTSCWEDTCEQVLEAHCRLRHRNAHPDWLDGHGGSLSEEQLLASADDMELLARFYGYAILAVAGFTDLKPEFPSRHSAP